MNDIESIRDALVEAGWDRSISRICHWLANGDPFIVAEHDGRIIAYAILSLKVFIRDQLLLQSIQNAIEIKKGDGWGTDALVRPSYRGKNLYPSLATELLKQGKKAGVLRVLGAVDVKNRSSRAAHRRLGCHEICEVSYWQFLFFRGTRHKLLNEEPNDF
jgi:GNAT superfamily N-acetyltransferase